MIRPILVDIADAFAITVAMAGQLMTAAALAGLVGNLALSPVMDRVDRRTAIVGALAVMTLASLGCAAAPAFAALMVAYAAVGLAGITLLALIIAAAGDLYDETHRGQALGWILAGNVGVGLVFLPLLAAWAGWAGWRVVFIGLAIMAALATILARVFLPAGLRAPQAERLGYLATFQHVLRNRVAVALLVTVAAYHASIYGVSTFAGAVAVERFGATTAQTGLILAARALGMVVAGVLAARFSRTADWRIAAAGGIAGAVLGLIGYTVVPRLWGYAVTILLHGGMVGAADIAVVGLLLETEPNRRGSIAAMRSVMEGVGGSTGPAAGGAVIAASGYGAAAWLFTGMALIGAATVAVAARWRAEGTSCHWQQSGDPNAVSPVPDA